MTGHNRNRAGWGAALLIVAAVSFAVGAFSYRTYIIKKKSTRFETGSIPESVDPNKLSGYITTVFPARYVNLGPVLDGDVYVGTCSSTSEESRHCFVYSSPDGIDWRLLKDFSDGIHTEVPIVFHSKRGLYATLHPNPIELWRSADKGMTWDKVFSHPTERSIYCLLETEEYIFFGTWPEGSIYRSRDGVEGWEKVFEGAKNGFFSMLEVDGDDGQILFAGSWPLLRSDDGGASWRSLETTDIGPIRALFHDSDGSIIAIGDTGLLISKDRGESWQYKEMKLVADHLAHFSTLHNGYIYIGGDTGVVLRSGDQGDTWERFFELPQGLNPKKRMSVRGITAWEDVLYVGTSHYLFSGDPRTEFYRIELNQ